MTNNIVVGLTGASGVAYAVRLIHLLVAAGRTVHLTISPSGRTVLQQELGIELDLERFVIEHLLLPRAARPQHAAYAAQVPGHWPQGLNQGQFEANLAAGNLKYHHYQDFLTPVASGSFLTAGMVVCPCSGGTLSSIAQGSSRNLIERAADVHLKERRKLILVPRETPLSLIHLENYRRCTEAGAVVLPAMPGFYHGARTLTDLVDFVVARICDQLGLPLDLHHRWGTDATHSASSSEH